MDRKDQPGEPDELRSIDRALLLALSRVQRDGAPLSVDQEHLLDGWVAGRLSGAEADRAADLIKRNAFAAERILERRLVTAADSGSAVPVALTTRILKAAQPTRAAPRKSFSFSWSILGSLQWSAAGAAIAATIAAGVFGITTWQANNRSAQRIQLAMVTIDDRRALSGAPQYRTLRSDGTPTTTASGFRDVDIPADLLRRAMTSAEGADHGAVASQLLVYLPPRSEEPGGTQIAIDSALADRLSGEWTGRMIVPVRVYDLDDARLRGLRESLPVQGGTRPHVLLTVRR